MSDSAVTGDRPNILVVDDTPASLQLLAGVLKDAGYRVRPVPDGRLALQAAEAEAPDLILLDVTMPGMDGFEVCARLKEHPTLRDVPILFISALTDTGEKVKAFQVGGVDYVTKPVQADEVRARVATHLALRRLQQDLQRKYEELRKLEKLRDNLTDMIVHDLRGPLTAIAGYIQFLRLKSDQLSDAQRRYIDRANTGVSSLMEMISSLLDVSRLEAGAMPLQREVCDLTSVAADAMKTLEGLALGRDVRLERPVAPVCASCDPTIVRRVVANLLGNAIKFTPTSGAITVAIMDRDGVARVEVRDTGQGIPPEYLDRIFDKFAQVEARRARQSYSTGLGLTFCKLATEAHGGRIGVDSEVGRGSTFWFELLRAGA